MQLSCPRLVAGLRNSWDKAFWRLFSQPGLRRDAFWMVAGTFAASLGGFVFWKVATYLYSPEIIGLASVIFSSTAFLSNLANLGLTASLVRFMPALAPTPRASLVTAVHLLSAGAGLAAALIFLFGRQWWAPTLLPPQAPLAYALIFVALTLTLTHLNVLVAVVQAERLTPAFLFRSGLQYAGQILLIIFLPQSWGAFGILTAVLVPSLISLVFFISVIRYWRNYPLAAKDWQSLSFRRMMIYGIGSLIYNQLWGLPPFVFPLVVLNVLGSAANAALGIAWLVYAFVFVIPNALSVALTVAGAHDPDRLAAHTRLALVTNLLLLIPLVVLMICLAQVVLDIFGSSYAQEASGLLRLLLLASLPAVVNGLHITVKQVRQQLVLMNLWTVALTALTVTFGSFFVLRLGLDGIGWGWLVGQSLTALAIGGPLWREMRGGRSTHTRS